MRVFLINFSSSILQDVAAELQKRSVDIAYWQGYRKYFEKLMEDTSQFPNTVFHTIDDAKRNIPPANENINEHDTISSDILEKLHDSDYLAIAMIGRMDYVDISFSQKKHIYYKYAQFWYGMLKKYKPESILFSAIPHSGLHYTLYALAKIFGVKTHIVDYTRIAESTRAFMIEDYTVGSRDIKRHLISNKDKKYSISDLSNDIKEYYLEQCNPKTDSTPGYMHESVAKLRKPHMRSPKLSSIYNNVKKGTFITTIYSYLKMFFGVYNQITTDKNLRGYQVKILIKKCIKKNKKLAKEYKIQQIAPDLSKNYVYVPLQVQPEATTAPHGGIFEDQLLMLQFLSRSIPDDWIIYVKENPTQLSYANSSSYLYRYPGYYKEIAGMRNTHLVPTDVSTFDLIENCKAVVTVTGTAGWEVLLRGKPSIVFGYPWYMDCEGVFKVSDALSCKEALRKI